SLAGPVAAIGAAVELALNFVDNVLHGKMEYPDRSSASYRSLTGLIDRRVDLDRSIAPADSRHHAALCVMASKVAYENEAFIRDVVTRRWQMEFVKFYNCWNGNQLFCVHNGHTCVCVSELMRVDCSRVRERVHGAGVRVLRQGGAGRGAGSGGVPGDAGVRRGAVARRPGPVVVQGAAARARARRLHARAGRAAQHGVAQVGGAHQGQAPEGVRVLHHPRRRQGAPGGEPEGEAAGDRARERRRAGRAVRDGHGVPPGEGGDGPAGRGVHVRAAAGGRRHARHVRGAEPGQAQEAALPVHLRRRPAAAAARRRIPRPFPALRALPPLRRFLQPQGVHGDTGRDGEPFVVGGGVRGEPGERGAGAGAERVPGIPEGRLLPGRVGAAADARAGGAAARPAVPQGARLRQRRRARRAHSQGRVTDARAMALTTMMMDDAPVCVHARSVQRCSVLYPPAVASTAPYVLLLVL
uniref:Uncharacterized protein n=1 Tax=Aegilops tauschii subsp. strangulata TaxID=200361 RepID=A0A453D680_AEGTS